MKIHDTTLWAAVAAAALLATTGCQSTGNTTQTATQKPPPPAPAPEVAAAEKPAAPAPPDFRTVYFDYDRWELGHEARTALRGTAQQIQASPGWGVVTVAGHCDERGSQEYNMALGDRRAAAVKRYLTDLGVPTSRVRTVSFGESRPAVRGSGETAWSRNRRAEFSLGSQQASR